MEELEFFEEWLYCPYCNAYGKTLGFHIRDHNHPAHTIEEVA